MLQAALSLVLLVGAGLFSQSLSKLQNTDLKLDATNRYILHINPQAAGYVQTQLEPLYQTIEQRFHSLPGIVKVGISTYTPMEDNNWSEGVQVQGRPLKTRELRGSRGMQNTSIRSEPVSSWDGEFARKILPGIQASPW